MSLHDQLSTFNKNNLKKATKINQDGEQVEVFSSCYKSDMLRSIKMFDKHKLTEQNKNIRGEEVIVSKNKLNYAFTEDEDLTEYYDTESELSQKIDTLVSWIKQSKHMVAYTGAGISTSADIPDYRGPKGLWTTAAKEEKCKKFSLREVQPTLGHLALAQLANHDYLKYVVSTNLDCLHLRAATKQSQLAELHGNQFKGKCNACNKYTFIFNDASIRTCKATKNCCGTLQGTAVGFGCELPIEQITNAKEQSSKCDLALVLGTSLRVSPACNLVEHSYKNGGHLVICNLQSTPYDKYASLVIRAKTDTVLQLVMQQLQLQIPTFTELPSFLE